MTRVRTHLRLLWSGAYWVVLVAWLCLILLLIAAWGYSYRSGLNVERKHEYSLASCEGTNYAELACGGGRFRLYWSWQQDRYPDWIAALRLLHKFTQSTKWSWHVLKSEPLKLPDPAANYQESLARQLGFAWHYEPEGPYGYVHHGVLMPAWAVVAVLGIPWLLTERFQRKRRTIRVRRERGLCIRCGYDLRASRERCPECGTLVGRLRI